MNQQLYKKKWKSTWKVIVRNPKTLIKAALFSFWYNLLFGAMKWLASVTLLFHSKPHHKRQRLYLYLQPIYRYKDEPKVILNAIFNNPERFLTMLGIVIALVAFVDLMQLEKTKDSHTLFQIFAVLLVFPTIFAAPFLALVLARSNPAEYVSIIAGSNISNSDLIRFTAYECLRIANHIGNIELKNEYVKNDAENILQCIRNMQSSIMIVDQLKHEIAIRLKVTHREISDDFFNFSPSIFVNRNIKLSDLINPEYKSKKNESNKENKIKVSNRDIRATNIIKNNLAIISHLKSICDLQCDLEQFSLIYQTRSISGATQLFIKFLQQHVTKDESLFEGKVRSINTPKELLTLIRMQNAHFTGAAVHRITSLAILEYLSSAISNNGDLLSSITPVKNIKKRGEVKILLNRIKYMNIGELIALSSKKRQVGDEKHFKTELNEAFYKWTSYSSDLIQKQRRSINEQAIEFFNKFMIKHKKNKKGDVYIVLNAYSRAVRAIIRDIVLEYYCEDVFLVILNSENDFDSFSARLLYHQIINELDEIKIESNSIVEVNNNNSDGKYSQKQKCEILRDRTWRSDLNSFLTKLNPTRDTVLYLSGADQLDFEKENNAKEPTVVAYKTPSMYFLESLYERVKGTHEDKTGFINTLIVAGEYKFRNDKLVFILNQIIRTTPLSTYKNKPRRSGLYKWNSNELIDVEIIHSDLVNIPVLLKSYSYWDV
ncbi:hypothetical protein [Glaciecola sp. 1036]|uniref:hypothetical protein n=1 Tax=Alteromonadaceae TaxID=72275 RepID=UPI003D052C0D